MGFLFVCFLFFVYVFLVVCGLFSMFCLLDDNLSVALFLCCYFV